MNLTKILAGLLLVLALALGLGALLLGRQTANRPVAPTTAPSSGAASQAAPTFAVVVAAKPIAAGQRLVADDLKIAQLPVAVASSFSNTDALLGRTTTMALVADAPLFEQQLISGLALQVEPGQRAVSVGIREAMAAGHHVRPGDFVDVFFTLDGKTDAAEVDSQTRLLLARTRVLAYGAASVENPPLTQAQRQQEEQEAAKTGSSANAARRNTQDAQAARSAATAVLAVPLQDVERLTLAEKYGQLSLALRHPDDSRVPDPALFAALPTVLQPVAGKLAKGEELQGMDRSFAGLRFKDLATGADSKPARRPPTITQAKAPAPAAPIAPPRSLEVYQGASVQTVRY
ncbi:Flp pilus assembly protein CpaB [Comamonas sp.]|uniref:Flp pilus assembly protein CpaB n=1 Tax=Comamonas sp. TaxID=34028 RepID=UPI003D102F1B